MINFILSWKISLTILCSILSSNGGNVYADTMVVVETTDEWVTCVDYNGNEWAFENSAGDWAVGDFASVMMYDNDTDFIYDDEIISAKYSGWCQGVWGYDADSGMPIVTFE